MKVIVEGKGEWCGDSFPMWMIGEAKLFPLDKSHWLALVSLLGIKLSLLVINPPMADDGLFRSDIFLAKEEEGFWAPLLCAEITWRGLRPIEPIKAGLLPPESLYDPELLGGETANCISAGRL